MLQGEVVRCLVVRIPVPRKIVSAHGRPANIEVEADTVCEEFPKNCFSVLICQSVQRGPSEFIEAGAKAVNGLKRFLKLCFNVPFTFGCQRSCRCIFRLP